MNKYYWNFNEDEEVWHNSYPTIASCIEEAKREKEDREIAKNHVFIGEVEPYEPIVYADYLIDSIREQAYEECGECCEGWLDGLNREQEEILEERLNKVLIDWLEETNNSPSFGKFMKISKYNLETGKEIEGEYIW